MKTLLVCLCLTVLTPTASASTGPTIGGCPVLSSSSEWNRDVSADPVDTAMSDTYIASITNGGSGLLHPDFGSNPQYGIPYVVVPQTTKPRRVRFTAYGDESDPGPYPIPFTAPREYGSDHHVLAVQQGTCKLYEMFEARARPRLRRWDAGSGAVFDLTQGDDQRQPGWTSADAAGLPILPGLVRRDEVESPDGIQHALRFTAPHTQAGYVFPAEHYASSSTDATLPPMGLRLRLKASFDLSGFHGDSLVILTALEKYGMILADNGSSWYISGATDTGWNDTDLDQMKRVPGSAFEVVAHGAITTN